MEKKSVNIFYSELNILSQDNLSGSKELLNKLNKLILDNFNYIEFDESFYNNLFNTFQSFEAIHKYLIKLKSSTRDGKKSEILSFLENYKDTSRVVYDKIYDKLKIKISSPIVILTLSNSETIFEVIKYLNHSSLVKKVIVSESRPQNEGRILVEKFLNENIDTELIVEAQIPDYVKNIDLALIGADKILANGNVINKIGSKVLCLSCKFYNKPVYVLSDISKFSDELEFSQINHPKNEIWQNSPELVSISNYYFEEIDKELITEIISEN